MNAPKKDLNYYMSLPYTMVARQAEGRFYFYIPELSLMAEGNSYDEAARDMDTKKEEYFRRILALDLEETVRLPQTLAMRRQLSRELTVFSIKSVIIAVIFGAVFLTGLLFVNDLFINQALGQLPRKAKNWVIQSAAKFERMSPQEKEALRHKIKMIAHELRPLLEELQPSIEHNGIQSP